MKESITKYFSIVLTWILFLNFIYVSFTLPVNYSQEKNYPEFTQAAFSISAAISEQTQKKESYKRLNSTAGFYFSSNEPLIITPGFTSFLKTDLSNFHFHYFLTSHFFSSGT